MGHGGSLLFGLIAVILVGGGLSLLIRKPGNNKSVEGGSTLSNPDSANAFRPARRYEGGPGRSRVGRAPRFRVMDRYRHTTNARAGRLRRDPIGPTLVQH
jgi:hypothetical protein